MLKLTRERRRYRLRGGPLGGLALVLLFHVLSSLHWQAMDAGPPDGDEAGHLGAVELYKDLIDDAGIARATYTAFTSPSDYPPLFALLNGAILSWLPVQGPFPRGMGGLLTAWSSLALVAVAWMTTVAAGQERLRNEQRVHARAWPRRFRLSPGESGWAGVIAALAYATFPLASATARHALLEPFVALWVALSLGLALRTRGFSRTIPTLLLAATIAAGLLSKQTFLLYVAAPLGLLVIAGIRTHGAAVLSRLGLLVLTALPLPALWVATHWESQAAYGAASMAAKADVGLLLHLAYYPVVLFGLGLGLAWTLPLLIGALHLGARSRSWLLTAFFLVLVTLTLIPKKYPRLIVPALPLAASLLAVGTATLASRRGRDLLVGGAGLVGLLQQAAVTIPIPGIPPDAGTWRPAFLQSVDPGCPQIWIRTPRPDALGLDPLLQVLKSLDHDSSERLRVGFVREPTIPCEYETTFDYAYHLLEFARRHDIQLEDIPVFEMDPDRFLMRGDTLDLVLSTEPWCSPGASWKPPPQAWTPPPVSWRIEKLGDRLPASPAHGSAEVLHGENQPPRDLCDLRKDFELVREFTPQHNALQFHLLLYQRIRHQRSGQD